MVVILGWLLALGIAVVNASSQAPSPSSYHRGEPVGQVGAPTTGGRIDMPLSNTASSCTCTFTGCLVPERLGKRTGRLKRKATAAAATTTYGHTNPKNHHKDIPRRKSPRRRRTSPSTRTNNRLSQARNCNSCEGTCSYNCRNCPESPSLLLLEKTFFA